MPLAVLNASLERPGWLSRSAFTQVVKAALGDLGIYWASKILKKHFTAAGAREYSYSARKPAYMRQKLRRYGHQDPFVLKPGRGLQRRLLRRAGFRISATSKAVTITLKTGSGLHYKHYAKELTAVSARDKYRLQVHLVNRIKKRLPSYGGVLVKGR